MTKNNFSVICVIMYNKYITVEYVIYVICYRCICNVVCTLKYSVMVLISYNIIILILVIIVQYIHIYYKMFSC